MWRCVLDISGSPYEYCTEASILIAGGGFLDRLKECQLLSKRSIVHELSYGCSHPSVTTNISVCVCVCVCACVCVFIVVRVKLLRARYKTFR